MGEPARDLTSSLSPIERQQFAGDELPDVSKVVPFRPTPVVSPLSEDEIVRREMEGVGKEIEEARLKLKWLFQRQAVLEIGGAKIKNFISTCGDDFFNKIGQDIFDREVKKRRGSYADNPKKLTEILGRCQDCDQDLISAILFIFGISGTDLDLQSIDFMKMNPKNSRDHEMMKRLSVFFNGKMGDAIRLINDTLTGEKKEAIQVRIRLIERAAREMSIAGQYYRKAG